VGIAADVLGCSWIASKMQEPSGSSLGVGVEVDGVAVRELERLLAMDFPCATLIVFLGPGVAKEERVCLSRVLRVTPNKPPRRSYLWIARNGLNGGLITMDKLALQSSDCRTLEGDIVANAVLFGVPTDGDPITRERE
jgi:hypothetical protein